MPSRFTESRKSAPRKYNGTAYDIEVYIVVQWPWLILPGLLVLSGISFLTSTIVYNNNAGLWKPSVFALLYHGLSGVDDNVCATASSIELQAADTNVQLRSFLDEGNMKLELYLTGLGTG